MSDFTNEGFPKIGSEIDRSILRSKRTLEYYLPKTGIDTVGVQRVASIGCGMFFEARGLKEAFPNAQILGVDKDEELYGAVPTTRIVPEGVEMIFTELTGESSVLKKGQYDFIIARNPDIHRGSNWGEILKLCKASLKPGGFLMITLLTSDESKKAENLMKDFELLIKEENHALTVAEKREDLDDSYVIIVRNNS